MPRVAFAIHLYYDELAVEIIEILQQVSPTYDLFLTGPAVQSPIVQAALGGINGHWEIVETDERGRDVAPFLDVLSILVSRKYDLFCKLHTKAGRSGYAREWRNSCLDSLIRSNAKTHAIIEAFARDPFLCLLGPKRLYISAGLHMLDNAEETVRVARVCFPGEPVPMDWGFFAGTMFWGRTKDFMPFANLRRVGIEFEANNATSDGRLEHAVERAFGLPAAKAGKHVGLVDDTGVIEITDALKAVTNEPLQQRFVELKRIANANHPKPSASAIDELGNPLLHYLRNDAEHAFDPNPYFHNAWYARENPDASQAGLTPLQHYLFVGAKRKRNPGPEFNTSYYLATHPDVAASDQNPLSHYFQYGRRLGYLPTRPSGGETAALRWFAPRPVKGTFDKAQEAAFLAMLADMPPDIRAHSRDTLVSVVIPVLEIGPGLVDALGSALGQTHQNLEVLLADCELPEGHLQQMASRFGDGRIKIIQTGRNAASGRNAALRSAAGRFVAYLEPDCVWRSTFLEIMISWMTLKGARCAHCVAEFGDEDRVWAYRGEQFDRKAPHPADRIDLSALCHDISLCEVQGGFDESSEFSVPDFVLRCAEVTASAFAPFVGCSYSGMRFAIKTDLPRMSCGDRQHTTAHGLSAALERTGRSARVDYRGEWYAREASPREVAIVLRGSLAYDPRPSQLSALWVIGNLDDVSFEELDWYDLVIVGSQTDAALLATVTRSPVTVLPVDGGVSGEQRSTARLPHGSNEDVFEACARVALAHLRIATDTNERPVRRPTGAGKRSTVTSGRGATRVHVIHRIDSNATQSSAYVRLLLPLTSDHARQIELTRSSENSIDAATECDVCIVSRDAIDDQEKILLLVDRARQAGTRIIVDNDDAFGLVDPADPYFQVFAQRDESMRLLMRMAEQCWFSTEPLADVYREDCASVKVIPNSLDARVWSMSSVPRCSVAHDKARLLCMGTWRHGSDLALVLPALDELAKVAKREFELTIIGVTDEAPQRPWLRRLSPPASATTYPRFVRWLNRQGPFDVGLAPLKDTPFNSCKSDIKFLDYSALGLPSIVSDVRAYGGDAKTRGLAWTVQNTPDAWADALDHALGRQQQIVALASAAHRYVWEERSTDGSKITPLSTLIAY